MCTMKLILQSSLPSVQGLGVIVAAWPGIPEAGTGPAGGPVIGDVPKPVI